MYYLCLQQPMRHAVPVQSLDPRMRLLIQQQQQQRAMAAQGAAPNQQQQQFIQPNAGGQQQPQQFVAGAPTAAPQQQRMPGPRNPLDPYDHLVQQRQQTQQMTFNQPQGKPNTLIQIIVYNINESIFQTYLSLFTSSFLSVNFNLLVNLFSSFIF